MLLVALAPLPYGYYTLVRIMVAFSAGFLEIAKLLNPLTHVHLDRHIWALAGNGAAVWSLVSL